MYQEKYISENMKNNTSRQDNRNNFQNNFKVLNT